MKPLPTLRQLRFLVAVIDKCHFGQAADACHVTQSTLSAGIQELEALLGVQLLERTKRSVMPTPLGRDLAARAATLLKGAEDMVDVAQAARAPMSGKLRLGVIPTIGPFLLPRALPSLRSMFPLLQIYLREDQTERLLDRLEAGELDAALLALPYDIGNYESMDIGEDRFWGVFPPGHRLSGTALRPRDIAVENLLLLEEGHCLRDQALAACSLEGAQRNAAFQGTSLYTLVQMVANGLGMTLVPQLALDAGILRGLDLATAPLEGSNACRRLGLIWRRTSGRTETFQRLGKALREIQATPRAA